MSSSRAARNLVDVGGYRLAIELSGSGGPPVVCLSCLGGSHSEWSDVIALLAGATTCITYGRPALGGSDPLPAATLQTTWTGRAAADQLRHLLRRSGLTPPYVLATSSIGAYLADQFAACWPDEIAGLVLIDPTNITLFPKIERPDERHDDDAGGIKFSRERCLAEQRQNPPLAGTIPSVVLSSAVGRWLNSDPTPWHPLTMVEVDHLWQSMQQEWVERLGAHHVVADDAGHFVHRDNPQLTALVIEEVLAARRTGTPVHLDHTVLAAAGAQVRGR